MKELRSKKNTLDMGFSGRVVNNTVLSIHPHYVTISHQQVALSHFTSIYIYYIPQSTYNFSLKVKIFFSTHRIDLYVADKSVRQHTYVCTRFEFYACIYYLHTNISKVHRTCEYFKQDLEFKINEKTVKTTQYLAFLLVVSQSFNLLIVPQSSVQHL